VCVGRGGSAVAACDGGGGAGDAAAGGGGAQENAGGTMRRNTRIRFNGDVKGMGLGDDIEGGIMEIERGSAAACTEAAEEHLDVWVLLNYSGLDAIKNMPYPPPPSSPPLPNHSYILPFSLSLIVRSAGEFRLSDFCLYESSYAEFFVIDKLWPDVDVEDFRDVREGWRGRRKRVGS